MTSKLMPIVVVVLCSVALIGAGYAAVTYTSSVETDNSSITIKELYIDFGSIPDGGPTGNTASTSIDVTSKITSVKDSTGTTITNTLTVGSLPSIYIKNGTGLTTGTLTFDFGSKLNPCIDVITVGGVTFASGELSKEGFSIEGLTGSEEKVLSITFKNDVTIPSSAGTETFKMKVTIEAIAP